MERERDAVARGFIEVKRVAVFAEAHIDAVAMRGTALLHELDFLPLAAHEVELHGLIRLMLAVDRDTSALDRHCHDVAVARVRVGKLHAGAFLLCAGRFLGEPGLLGGLAFAAALFIDDGLLAL